MANSKLVCKWCGKEYEACPYCYQYGDSAWRNVACCMEHAQLYWKDVLEARAEVAKAEITTPTTTETPVVKTKKK